MYAASWLYLWTCLLASPTSLTLVVSDSLEADLVQKLPDEGAAVAAQVARLLRWRGDVNKHIHKGDTLQVLYEPRPLKPRQTAHNNNAHVYQDEPTLLAMHFSGRRLNLQAYRFAGNDHIERYYDEYGTLIEPVLRHAPVLNYVQITDIVQKGRGKRRHRGIDLKAPTGSAVWLPFAGYIKRVNWSRKKNGNCLEVIYQNGHIARFLHLQSVVKNIRPGQYLAAGVLLGYVGSTGRSNAPHLHYEIINRGQPLEPLQVHGKGTMQLAGTSLAAFQEHRMKTTQRLRNL